MKWKRSFSVVIFVILALLSTITILWVSDYAVRHRRQHIPAKDSLRPFRVTSAVDSGVLYAYVLHADEKRDDQYARYSAVIRLIDTGKDDYRSYCRYVIRDIVKTAGTDKIRVHIYDDGGARELAEVDEMRDHKVLKQAERDSISRHLVAVFSGSIRDDEWTNRLEFYPHSGNRLTSKEIFEPASQVNRP